MAHDVHHIDYDKKHCDPMNLITLCRCCHVKTSFGNRVDWTRLLQEMMIAFTMEGASCG